MEIKGTIKLIGETQSFGSNGFRKREVVITTDEQYPQTILVEFVQDKTDVLNNYKVGQNVTIGINIRGREWVNPQGETKYFNSIQGWRIEEDTSHQPTQAPGPEPKQESNQSNENLPPEEEDDDLPF